MREAREALSALGQTLMARRRYRIMELARGLDGVITLGRGDPDLPTPAHIVAAAEEALRNGATHYTAVEGQPALREAIARKLRSENGLEVEPAEVLVTSGAQEALFLAVQCLLDRDGEALITDPYYGAYTQMVAAAGGRLVPIPAQEGTMEPDVPALRTALTPSTQLLILVSPNNPSTNVTSLATLETLADLAREHDLYVLSDELYEKLTFDGAVHHSIAALPGMRARTVVVNGLAKTYCMTGWRIGYAAGPGAIIEAMARLKQAISICAPTVAQAAALAALEGSQACVADLRETYTRRRGIVLQALDDMAMPYVPPQGTFYVYADVSPAGAPSDAFAEALLTQGRVLVFPSSEFGSGRRHIRLSLLQPEAVLQTAMARVAAVWRDFTAGGTQR